MVWVHLQQMFILGDLFLYTKISKQIQFNLGGGVSLKYKIADNGHELF